MKKWGAKIATGTLVALIVCLAIYFLLTKSVRGRVAEVYYTKTLMQKEVTILRLVTEDGEYLLGVEGHDFSIKLNCELEVVYFRWDYIARDVAPDGSAKGYHKVKSYKIIKAP